MLLDQGNPRGVGEVFDGFEGPVAIKGAAQGGSDGGADRAVGRGNEVESKLRFGESGVACGFIEDVVAMFAV